MTSTDFDFLHGEWAVQNRRLRDVTDPDGTVWVEFVGVGTCEPVLSGGGNVDRLIVHESPLGAFEGLALRLYSPDEDLWRIWWSSDRAPGVLDEPVVGRFVDGHGVFDAVQRIRDTDVLVRFEWFTEQPDPRWQQAFSWDGGSTWAVNWEMTFLRGSGPAQS
ncbi:hypothetical protein [Cellulomonas sp. URHE0023]|uniref:hypothetical protein n=1 Tax=Cellulomonas sp. URHE0023 TaxID=1380354 RepID=UPI00047F2794|nr:hypothetical protein [Cellulomonas sp. URHE0023]